MPPIDSVAVAPTSDQGTEAPAARASVLNSSDMPGLGIEMRLFP
jgi:hypothetical protein